MRSLNPLEFIYKSGMRLRKKLYEKGIFKSEKLPARVISIGNITLGGSGKTPLAAFIAGILHEKGEKVCILTRGYKRKNPRERVLVSDGNRILAGAEESGDEPFELAEKLIGKAAILADRERAAAGKWAIANLGITAFILDDGFQHLKLRRDLDIVAIDASNPFGNGKLLPFGKLREPPESLARAAAIVITRANLCPDTLNLQNEIAGLTKAPIFISQNKIKNEVPDRNTSYFAFCGLGNPENFYAQLKQEGFKLNGEKSFPDHYSYRQIDADAIEAEAGRSGGEILLTTAKDGVKLAKLNFTLPLKIINAELIFDDREAFIKLICP